jgi:hypothetical protein
VDFCELFMFSSAPPYSDVSAGRGRLDGDRRLTGYQLVHEGKIKGRSNCRGVVTASDQIMLRLKQQSRPSTSRPAHRTIHTSERTERIFGGRDPSYAVAM